VFLKPLVFTLLQPISTILKIFGLAWKEILSTCVNTGTSYGLFEVSMEYYKPETCFNSSFLALYYAQEITLFLNKLN
jgi:hypothetical protein